MHGQGVNIFCIAFILAITNACWFRVKPATKQRSEGEKVYILNLSCTLFNVLLCMVHTGLCVVWDVLFNISLAGENWGWCISDQRSNWKIFGECVNLEGLCMCICSLVYIKLYTNELQFQVISLPGFILLRWEWFMYTQKGISGSVLLHLAMHINSL